MSNLSERMYRVNLKFRRLFLIFSIVLLLALIISTLFIVNSHDLMSLFDNQTATEHLRSDEEQRVIDELPNDAIYSLPRNATEYQISLFEDLFVAHERFSDNNNEETQLVYAQLIARNFIADFYTLTNKSNRLDVGGMQFIMDSLSDEFEVFAQNTFYLYLNQQLNLFGVSSLPEVTSTRVLLSEPGFYRQDLDEWPWAEYLPIITIDIEWNYADSTLPYLDNFQSSARFILMENEGIIRIHSILEIPQPASYGW